MLLHPLPAHQRRNQNFCNMEIIKNIDLLSVGIASAATGILGFLVFFSNKKSVTNKVFFYFSIITILWSIVNYLNYQSVSSVYGLWLIRLTVFLGAFHALSFYQLFTVFPDETKRFSKMHRLVLIPGVILISLLTFTPYIFFAVKQVESGRVIEVSNGPLLPVYGITIIALILGGIFKLLKKVILSKGLLHRQMKAILFGATITFSLLIIFNFVLPAFFNNPKYIPLGALFLFPLISFTSYAILKQNLFRIKVASTGLIVFMLSTLLFIEIIYADTISLIIFRSSIFTLVLIFGINLIRSVLREVEQREHIEALAGQLKEANEKLKDLDKLKTEFLSLASHQLRSPLTAIKGYASMLSEGDFGSLEDKQGEAVKRIYASAQGLVNVVEDLLNVSKIEQGGMKYEFMPTDLGLIVSELAGEMKIPAENKHLEFKAIIPEGETFVANADPIKLKQVFLNLVDNSIKYTQDGFVHLELSKDQSKGKLIFSVKDSGIGISPETKDKLFQKFSRGEGGKLNTGGSGLGLYLAREIVKAHKGDIKIQSEGLGKGSIFIVSLPDNK